MANRIKPLYGCGTGGSTWSRGCHLARSLTAPRQPCCGEEQASRGGPGLGDTRWGKEGRERARNWGGWGAQQHQTLGHCGSASPSQAPQPMPCGSKMNLPTSTLPKFPAHKNMSKVKWLLSAPNFGGSLSLVWGSSTSSPHLHSGPLGKAPASIPSLDSQQPYFPPPDVLPGASPYCSPL